MQAGTLPAGCLTDITNTTYHPLWRLGLDGSGQIMGVGDTGLDMTSCWFTDPTVPFMDNIIWPGAAPPSPPRSNNASSSPTESSGPAAEYSDYPGAATGGVGDSDPYDTEDSSQEEGSNHTAQTQQAQQAGVPLEPTAPWDPVGQVPVFRSSLHRKVVQYVGFVCEWGCTAGWGCTFESGLPVQGV